MPDTFFNHADDSHEVKKVPKGLHSKDWIKDVSFAGENEAVVTVNTLDGGTCVYHVARHPTFRLKFN